MLYIILEIKNTSNGDINNKKIIDYIINEVTVYKVKKIITYGKYMGVF